MCNRLMIWTRNAATGLAISLATSASASAQLCPHQLLFTVDNNYYYSVKDCSTGQMSSVVHVYSGVVTTGCGTGGCASREIPKSVLKHIQTVGTGNGDRGQTNPANTEDEIEKKPEPRFRKVPAEAEIMTPWGRNTISMYGGYPKFLATRLDGQERFFKVYRVMITGNNESLGFGLEVEGIPVGIAKVDCEISGYGDEVVKLQIRDNFGTTEFECLYEIPEDDADRAVPIPAVGSGPGQ